MIHNGINREALKKNLKVLDALANDIPIQYRNENETKNEWRDYCNPGIGYPAFFFDDLYEWRIKPELSYRPWKPEEVPVGCLLKNKEYEPFYSKTLLICVRGAWCLFMDEHSAKLNEETATVMLAHYEHSTDNGKTWQPCGVLV